MKILLASTFCCKNMSLVVSVGGFGFVVVYLDVDSCTPSCEREDFLKKREMFLF